MNRLKVRKSAYFLAFFDGVSIRYQAFVCPVGDGVEAGVEQMFVHVLTAESIAQSAQRVYCDLNKTQELGRGKNRHGGAGFYAMDRDSDGTEWSKPTERSVMRMPDRRSALLCRKIF
jgi:hypothetical protein